MLRVLFIVCVISFLIFPAYSQSLLNINLSKQIYFEGEVIIISGRVTTVIQDTPVTIQLISLGKNGEENIVQIAQLDVAQDGTFSHTIKAEGPQWQFEGNYAVRAFYGVGNFADKFFEYFKKEQGVSLNFEVEKPDKSGTFDIGYLIRGANVTDMIVDEEFFELIVLIETKSDGAMTLELPRTAIDAKKSDGTDDVFIVLIDGVEVPFVETQNDENSRIITIEFEERDSNIEVIGTFVIPEFGAITSMILAISIISIIILSKKDLMKVN